VLFSALIKDSITRKLILDYDGFFLFPSFIFEELQNHKKELLKKSKMSKKDFDILLNILLRKVTIVPTEQLLPYKDEAFEIIKDIDKNDVIFIACALYYHNAMIWSDDKKLKEQSRIQIINTHDFYTLFY
jgi:predicted nucleic acid-binding protein